ncbi:MAG: hypothetical protein Tsb0014_29730 [Pleurocapsa sp.]
MFNLLLFNKIFTNLSKTRFDLSEVATLQKTEFDRRQTKTTVNSGDSHENCYQKAVGIFFHHRDVKVVLEELREIGFPLSKISLIARHSKKHNWSSGLQICDRFNAKILELPEALRYLLHHYFNRGKYLVLVSGTNADIQVARNILSRRPKHSEVWQW